MLDTILNLLEKFNVPTEVVDQIKSALDGDLNLDTVKNIVNENKDKIPDVSELTSQLDGIEGLSGAADKLDDAKGLMGKAKGMLGM